MRFQTKWVIIATVMLSGCASVDEQMPTHTNQQSDDEDNWREEPPARPRNDDMLTDSDTSLLSGGVGLQNSVQIATFVPQFQDDSDSDEQNVDQPRDQDGDGISDDLDPCPTDPTNDSDGDGVCDSEDVCPEYDDWLDTDNDGTPDGCDDCPFDPKGDSDGDGVCDSDDICIGGDDTVDTDLDGQPDDCDICPTDALNDQDEDGVCDTDDLCIGADDRIDSDSDGVPDGCDACEGFSDGVDSDDDGIADGCDPCPMSNPDDANGNGICDDVDICTYGDRSLSLQERINTTAAGSVLDVGPDLIVDNVVIEQSITLRGNCDGNLTVWHCADTDMRAINVRSGGEVAIEGFVFEGCDGSEGEEADSGAIRFSNPDSLTVRSSIFRDNAGFRGAAIVGASQENISVRIENTIIHHNHANDGGAIYIHGQPIDIAIVNNLIFNNSATDYCGAVWLRFQERARMLFVRNTVWGNTSDRNPALETHTGQGPFINSSIVVDNIPGNLAGSWFHEYSMVSGSHPFVDPERADFRLRIGSSAIDSGDPNLGPDTNGTSPDMGCDLDLLPRE